MPDPVSAALGSAGLKFIGAQQAASATRRARQQSADAQIRAAEIQAEASRFRPVGITTGLSSTRYVMGPDGYLVEAGYDLRPDLLQQREQLMGLLPGALSQALTDVDYYRGIGDRYSGMGEQVLSGIDLDPTQAAAKRTALMQELLAPGRAIGEERMYANLAAKGLTGMGADIGGGMAVSPIAAARAQEQEQINKAIAAESFDRAQSDIDLGLRRAGGLFGTAQGYQFDTLGRALAPYQSALAQAQGIEALGAGALDIGSALARGERTAAQTAGGALSRGMMGAAQTQQLGANQQALLNMAMYGGLSNRLANFDFDQLDQSGENAYQDTGFRFYDSPVFPLSYQQSFAAPNYRPLQFNTGPLNPIGLPTSTESFYPLSP